MGGHKAEQRLQNDGGDGEQAGLVEDHPKPVAADQEGEIAEPDELGHAPVEHREIDREARGIGHEHDHQRQQRQGHQEGDGRFAPH
jgi:hypothetical protein